MKIYYVEQIRLKNLWLPLISALTTSCDSDNNVVVNWANSSQVGEFPSIWLRDNCQCPKCFHPVSKARLVLMRENHLDIKPQTVTFNKESRQVKARILHYSMVEVVSITEAFLSFFKHEAWDLLARRPPQLFRREMAPRPNFLPSQCGPLPKVGRSSNTHPLEEGTRAKHPEIRFQRHHGKREDTFPLACR